MAKRRNTVDQAAGGLPPVAPAFNCASCAKPDNWDDMVECEVCEKWFHFRCVGLTSFAPDDPWVCQPCTTQMEQGKVHPVTSAEPSAATSVDTTPVYTAPQMSTSASTTVPPITPLTPITLLDRLGRLEASEALHKAEVAKLLKKIEELNQQKSEQSSVPSFATPVDSTSAFLKSLYPNLGGIQTSQYLPAAPMSAPSSSYLNFANVCQTSSQLRVSAPSFTMPSYSMPAASSMSSYIPSSTMPSYPIPTTAPSAYDFNQPPINHVPVQPQMNQYLAGPHFGMEMAAGVPHHQALDHVSLSVVRRSIGALPKFSGNKAEWAYFEAAYYNSAERGRFSNVELVDRLEKSLMDPARK